MRLDTFSHAVHMIMYNLITCVIYTVFDVNKLYILWGGAGDFVSLYIIHYSVFTLVLIYIYNCIIIIHKLFDLNKSPNC